MLRFFERFALVCEWLIAHPVHFVGFLAVTGLWLPWAASRGFDSFSQLSVNTPTTLLEYAFAILTLAAARSGANSAFHVQAQLSGEIADILTELRLLVQELHAGQAPPAAAAVRLEAIAAVVGLEEG